MLSPSQIKAYVTDIQDIYSEIEHKAYNSKTDRYSKSHTEMWIEASQIAPKEWQEILRVLAQGESYYGLEWAA